MECETARPYTHVDHIGSGGLTLWNNEMKHEEALWSHQGIVRSNKPHLLYCLVYRSWCYLEKTYTTSSFPTCLVFFKLKGWCSFRRMEIFSLSRISICVGGFSAMSFFYKKHLGDCSTSQWLPFSENVCIVIFFYLPFVSIWFEKLHITHCIHLFFLYSSSSFQMCNVPLSCIW